MIGEQQTAKRLSDHPEWIGEVCRRFSEATGWPLRFTPYPEGADENDSSDDGYADEMFAHRASVECCWSAELKRGDDALGLLHIDLPQDPGDDRSFLAVCDLATLTAESLSRVLTLSHAVERKTQDISLLLTLESSSSAANPVPTLEEYLRAVVQLTRFRSAVFFLLSPDAQELNARLTYGMNGESIPFPRRQLADLPPDVTAFRSRRTTLRADRFHSHRLWLPEGCLSGHCVAVESASGPTGTLWLFDRRRRTLDLDEDTTIACLARRMGEALERVVLLRESTVHHRQKRDLQAASLCQQQTNGPQRVHHRRFESASICSSRYELGGDLCDVIPLNENSAVLLVGDASGDSVPAAMVMSAVRGAVRAMIGESSDAPPQPDAVLARANQTLCGLSANHQFMSLLLGVLDFRAGILTYASAGHPPALHVQEGECRLLDLHDLLLGVLPEVEYSSRTVRIQSGDLLVAYSDGIHEAMDAHGRLFGIEGIANAVRKAQQNAEGHAPPHLVLDTVLQSVAAHADESGGDDRTLLVLKVR